MRKRGVRELPRKGGGEVGHSYVLYCYSRSHTIGVTAVGRACLAGGGLNDHALSLPLRV